MATMTWLNTIDVVEKDFADGDKIRQYSSSGKSLAEALEEFFENCEEVEQYTVTDETIFESPGYDTGVVAASWIEKGGKLNMITYQWEC